MKLRTILLLFTLIASVATHAQELTPAENYNALGKAMSNNDAAEIKRLVEAGADVNYVPEEAVPLIAFCFKELNIPMIKALLDNGQNPNMHFDIDGEKVPMLFAIMVLFGEQNQKEAVEVVGLLLESGADPNKLSEGLPFPLLSFVIVAHTEGKLNSKELIELLLKHKANVNQAINTNGKENFDGVTALHLACRNKRDDAMELVQLLMKNGANINARADVGIAPLQVALEEENYEMAKYLLKKGSDPRLNEDDKLSPFELAKEGAYPADVSKAIIKAGK